MGQISSRERRARDKARVREMKKINQLNRKPIGTIIWHSFWWLVIVGAVAIHGVGGWHFSGQIAERAFVVKNEPLEANASVVAIDGSSITLQAADETLESLRRDVVLGVETESGYLQLQDRPTEAGAEQVTRRFTVLTGGTPSVGSQATVDSNYYPENWFRSELGVSDVKYNAELGEFDAWEVIGSKSIWMIHIHGKGASMLEAARLMLPLSRAGYPQLAITYRNDPDQPTDPSGYYQYGSTEWEDVVGAIDYAINRGADGVVLVGYSTGAALALKAALHDNPGHIKGLIFDSPNLDISRAISFAAEKERFLGLPVLPTVTATAKMFSAIRLGLNYKILNILEDGEHLRVPTLVFHGTEDDVIPMSASLDLAAMRRQFVELVEVEGAGHVETWNADSLTYVTEVIGLLLNVEG